MMTLAAAGFSSKNVISLSFTMPATIPSTSPLPSFVFVWPSNCGCGTLTDTTTVSPSRMSSPVSRSNSFSLRSLLSSPYFLIVAVSARRKPERWVPPSMVWMLLQ